MNIIDKAILEWSYKTTKGYPDINSQEDIALFESMFGFNFLSEAKHPFEYLSKEAQELGKDLIQKLNLDDDEIIAHAKNRIIVYTDRPRKEVFQALANLGYEKQQVRGSSAGGYVTPEGIEVIHKSQTSIGNAGLGNEDALVTKIKEAIAVNGGPINVKFVGKNKVNIDYTNVKHAKGVGKITTGNRKADVILHSNGKEEAISVKEDKAFRWSSAMSTHKDVFKAVLEPGLEGTEDLKLVQDENNPFLLNMMNPKNNKPYGSIYVLDAPDMDFATLAFGSDNAVVVKATFTDGDFKFENGLLTIQTAGNYTEEGHFDEEDDKPIIRFERNASKATRDTGIYGRGITIRTVPARRYNKRTDRANILALNYKDLDI
mgnify:FL=1